VDAGKAKLGPTDALKLAKQASHIIVARGKKVVAFDMKHNPPDNATLLKLMLGPTGNLRAPTIRKGETLLVGFHDETYAERLA